MRGDDYYRALLLDILAEDGDENDVIEEGDLDSFIKSLMEIDSGVESPFVDDDEDDDGDDIGAPPADDGEGDDGGEDEDSDSVGGDSKDEGIGLTSDENEKDVKEDSKRKDKGKDANDGCLSDAKKKKRATIGETQRNIAEALMDLRF